MAKAPNFVAERVAKISAGTPARCQCEGVIPLAVGHFALRHMKDFAAPKDKSKQERRTLRRGS